ELIDTGVFADDRYFDVLIEYAKASPDDLLIQLSVINRGPEAASLDVLPTLWFRNTWSWGYNDARPRLSALLNEDASGLEIAERETLGTYWLTCEASPDGPELLFTENETNNIRIFGSAENPAPFVKDGINDYVVRGRTGAINPQQVGTKAAARYRLIMQPGEA